LGHEGAQLHIARALLEPFTSWDSRRLSWLRFETKFGEREVEEGFRFSQGLLNFKK